MEGGSQLAAHTPDILFRKVPKRLHVYAEVVSFQRCSMAHPFLSTQ